MAQREPTYGTAFLSTRVVTRRSFVHAMSAASMGAIACSAGSARAQTLATAKQAVHVVQPSRIDELNTRAKIVLEIDGNLSLKPAEDDQKQDRPDVPAKGKSTLDYFEKIAFSKDEESGHTQPAAAARRMLVASAENWISGKLSSSQLRRECFETRFMPRDGIWQQYCESMPLDAREVQLLHSPINSAAIELLLPLEPAKPNSTWTIRAQDAQLIFNLDAVHKSDLVATITKVEKGITSIDLKGALDATANSVATRLDVNGNFQVKLGKQCALVTWVGLIIKEERQVSQAEPGFVITARVRMIREETDDKIAITGNALRKMASEDESHGRWLVRLHSQPGLFSTLADRRWHIHRDSGAETILRMVENNTVIAQCNVSHLTPLESGQQLTLEGLQADIKASIGDGFREFLESSEKVTSTKLRLVRMVVAGELEDVPIQWIYNHLSDDNGRRLLMVFTMGGNVTDRFAAADDQMGGSLEFLPGSSAGDGPTPSGDAKSADERTADRKRTSVPKR